MAGTTVGQLELDLLLNSDAFRTQLQTAVNNAVTQTSTNMGSTVSAAFSKIGKIAVAAFSARAIAGFVKETTELGSTLQEVQNVVDTTFTTMNENVNAFASSAMKNFGLSEAVAKKYVGTMGAMSKSFGFTEQEAYNMSTTLTGLVGDVASFYNLDSDTAYTKLKAVFTGETEALKDLGVVMTQTALDEFALAKGYGKTTKAMSEQEKVALRYAFVQEQLSGASGDFLRTQDGWANQMRVLSLQWESFKANIGQGLIAVLTPLVKSLNTVMEKLVHFSAVFKAMVEQIYGKQPESAGSGVAAVAGEMAQLESNTDGVGTAAQKTAKKLKSLMGFDNLNILSNSGDSSASSAGGGIGSYDIPTTEWDTSSNVFADAISVSQKEIDKMKNTLGQILKIVTLIGVGFLGWKLGGVIGSLAGVSNGLLGVGTALTLVGGALEAISLTDAWKNGFNVENFFGALTGGGGLVAGATAIGKVFGKTTLGAAIGGIVAGVPMYITGIKDALMNGLNWLNGIIIPAGATMAGAGVGAIIGSLGGPIGAGVGAIVGLVIGALTDLGLWVHEHWAEISAWFKREWTKLTQWATNSLETIKTFFINSWNSIKTFCVTAWDAISTLFVSFVDTMRNVWQSVTGWFSEKLTNFANNFVSAFTHVRNSVSALFVSFGESIKSIWNDATSWINERLTTLKNNFINIFTGIRDGIVNIFSQIKTAIKTPINAIISMLNRVIDGFNSLDIDMPNWVPGMGGKSLGFHIPRIPMLAEGGYVKPNTPQLAMIGDNRHQGEIVAPEGKISEAVAVGLTPILTTLQRLASALEKNGQANIGDIVVPVYLDGSIVDERVYTAQDIKALRSGGLA